MNWNKWYDEFPYEGKIVMQQMGCELAARLLLCSKRQIPVELSLEEKIGITLLKEKGEIG